MEGKTINDRYEVIRELKERRDGKIYLVVKDLQNNGEEKMLKGIGLFGPKEIADVDLEISLLRKLDNPYVVKLLDDFKFTGPGDFPFHAMIFEYLSGGDLHQFIETKRENEGGEAEEPWIQNDALGLSAQLAFALDYIHAQGIIHRDIKPENILLSGDHKVAKIADFNISRAAEGTITTGIVGSVDYLPPEAIKNEENQQQQSFTRDIWAMGIVFQMLCTFRNDSTGYLCFPLKEKFR